MADQSNITRVYSFQGLASNTSPHALKPSAATEQVNLQCLYAGALTVRPGLAAEQFSNAGDFPTWPDSAGGSVSYPCVAAIRFLGGAQRWAVWQTTDGGVFAKLGAD